jgi:hypothetical protein
MIWKTTFSCFIVFIVLLYAYRQGVSIGMVKSFLLATYGIRGKYWFRVKKNEKKVVDFHVLELFIAKKSDAQVGRVNTFIILLWKGPSQLNFFMRRRLIIFRP